MNISNSFNKFCLNTRYFIKKHSPELLTGIGVSGMITSTILAVKATPKAVYLIEEKKKIIDQENITKKDIILVTYKEYLPSILLSLASIGCIIGAGTINNKRNAALTTAYAISERTLLNYRDKVIETLGEKKEQKICNEIAQDSINKNPKDDSQIIITSKGNTLFRDSVSGRYFRSDIDKIRKIVNDLNRKMTYENYVSLSDFYYEIGLPTIKNGDNLGWNLDNGLIEPSFSTCLAENDEPCIVLDYLVSPRYEYDKLI